MKRRFLLASAAAAPATLLLGGCASQNIDSYAADKPVLDLRQYFNGRLDAYGIFTDRSGAVVKRFTVVMACSWVGDEGVLDEDFRYSDGSTQKRIWRLRHLGGGRYLHSSGRDHGRNGIGIDDLNPRNSDPVASHYRAELRGAGRVMHSHDGSPLPP
jgi:hypothetical protein